MVPIHPGRILRREMAVRELSANRLALSLANSSPRPATTDAPPAGSWIFARDGALTFMLANDRWWAGCSVPKQAARFMLKNMEVPGNVACFLAPTHAAQLRVALDKLESQQAIVAIVPDAQTLSVILHCDILNCWLQSRDYR